MVNFELKPQRVVVMLNIDPSASVARIVFSGGGASGQRDYAVRPNASSTRHLDAIVAGL